MGYLLAANVFSGNTFNVLIDISAVALAALVGMGKMASP
jgi:hypothetical protein